MQIFHDWRDLPADARGATVALGNFDGVTKENKMEGKLNGGGIPVTVDAGSGKVSLSVK